MSTARNRIAHKHFRLDVAKIKRAQRLLKTGSETEAVDRALDLVIAEYERNRLTREANERFVKSGIEIRDVYGKLAE
jgi:ribosomal protein S4